MEFSLVESLWKRSRRERERERERDGVREREKVCKHNYVMSLLSLRHGVFVWEKHFYFILVLLIF